MTKRFLLQKIKRSIPISNDVIHPNFNKYYLNRYKNQPIIPITQQYSYAYQRKRKPPIFRNFETRFAEDQIGSIDHESARARTCTHLYSSPLFSFRYRPSCAKFARVSTKIIARPRCTTDSRNESLLRVSVLSNPRVSKFSTIATPFPPPPPVNRIESTIFGSLRPRGEPMHTGVYDADNYAEILHTAKYTARPYIHGFRCFPFTIATGTRMDGEECRGDFCGAERSTLAFKRLGVAGFADFDSWEGRDGGMDGRRERGLEILNWNGDFEGEGCRLRIWKLCAY